MERSIRSADADFLSRELRSEIKHEYLAGAAHAKADTSNRHNAIAGNIITTLHTQLRGNAFKPWNSDTKVRLRLRNGTRFYYPDAMVVCRPNPESWSYQDDPSVIVEVISDSTRRTDEGEKRDAYLTIPGLSACLMAEQNSPTVFVMRRTTAGFVRENYVGPDAEISLPDIDATLALSELYEGIEFDS
ncbi:MAG: hypothetical protein CMO80_20090 [Verrucomicrobiales bacterium]|nr:hypothetical protein [Verrucomicrobiales bacterium]